MAGYAVECALKACIARTTKRYDFPEKNAGEYYIRKLPELVKLAKLEPERLEQARRSRNFANNWELVRLWTEESRYRKSDFMTASELITAIGHRGEGVLAWIKRYW